MLSLPFACIADGTDKAQVAYAALLERYHFVERTRITRDARAIIVLGGDGFMLQAMHAFMRHTIPFYGMNCGTVGFLMNTFQLDTLEERILAAKSATLFPLAMFARTTRGTEHRALAINEVSLLRETRQAAKIRISVDHVVRVQEMVADGILASTPAGSTAYNFSAGGPIIPLSANIMALTPLSAFRPRRWSGALLPHTSSLFFEVLEPAKRPVSAVADFTEIRDVTSVEVSEHRKQTLTVLFDPEHNLEERIIKEQFML